jgi:hypothetical protein
MRLFVGVLISLVAFGLIVRDMHFAQLATILVRAHYGWLVPSIGFTIVTMGVGRIAGGRYSTIACRLGALFMLGTWGTFSITCCPCAWAKWRERISSAAMVT